MGAGALALVLGAVIVRNDAERPAAAARAPVVSLDGDHVRFTEEFAVRHKIQAVPAEAGQLSPTIAVMGTVRYDVRKFAAIGARTAGRVRRVFRIAGDTVRAGDVLADIESVDLAKTQATAASLRAREQAAKSNQEREQHLAQAKVTAKREAETARAEYHALRAERHAAEKAVAALGGQARIRDRYPALAQPHRRARDQGQRQPRAERADQRWSSPSSSACCC